MRDGACLSSEPYGPGRGRVVHKGCHLHGEQPWTLLHALRDTQEL